MARRIKWLAGAWFVPVILAFAGSCVFGATINSENVADENNSFVYPAESGRDPFKPLLGKGGAVAEGPTAQEIFESQLKTIKIHGIIWDKAEPVVMINNEIHKPHDVVQELEITEITPEGVTLTYKGLSHTIFLIEKKKYE